MAEARISPYSLNDLKNTSDDALGNYLRGLGFKQDNSKLDFRLAVGYLAVIIAGVTFAADYKLGWEATKYWTAAAVIGYGVLNTVFTYSLYFVEKGLVFEGTKDGNKISIASKTKKYDPTYYITVTTSSPSTSPDSRQIKSPFTTWFTADGYFVARPFQQWLASSVDVIALADTKNAPNLEKDLVERDLNVGGTPKTTGALGGNGDGKSTRRGKKKS